MTVTDLFDPLADTDLLRFSDPALFSLPCAAPRRDSRLVGAGDVFFCIRGRTHDGHAAIPTAARNGAVCAVLDDPAAVPLAAEHALPWILIRDTAAAFLPACLSYHGHPERGMQLYAVTGTNGKTSVTYLLEAIFSAAPQHSPCAVFGTVENRIAGIPSRSENTTPAPEVTAALLSQARDAGVKNVLLEASSHALTQKRLSGLRFACGIFTNLSEDHLDYHLTLEDYFLAKRSLFFSCDRMLVNTDDAFGMRLYRDPAFRSGMHSFALSDPAADYPPLFLPRDLTDPPCSFIAANRLAAAACASMAGVPQETVIRAIRSMPPIPGRMECVRQTPFSVYIDYAHTPDALRRALTGLGNQLRQKSPGGHLHVVFGCGGDREREKRPQMGAIAASLADRIILTADNSRSEDVHDIIADILDGIPNTALAKTAVIEDRRQAIRHVLHTAEPGDTVLLAGKGHETYQTDRSGTHPFSEREIIQAFFTAEPHNPRSSPK